MRVCLFTDTLFDVNGVSRFIRDVGRRAFLSSPRRDLHLITSTRFAPVEHRATNSDDAARGGGFESAYVHNAAPLYARPMPGYPQLEVVAPPRRRLFELARRLRPDVIHVSTPGPVGVLGRRIAQRMGVPLVGTYHTDFPAYIDHLFNDPSLTWATAAGMRRFYAPFSRLFTRSADYGEALVSLGYPRERIERLQPGIDTGTFDVRFRDATGRVWNDHPGLRAGSVKVLYVGRVSVEKNLPMLSRVWPVARARVSALGVDAQLVVVGDGPYRERMASELAAHDAHFLGFRHGAELSRLYASADLFVFPSTTDTLGQVVMEAQSVGLPVIVTDQGGPGEVVDHERTGYVLPLRGGAEGRWVETIVGLVVDHDRRKTMGRAGVVKMAPMTIERSFEHFWGVHEDVLMGRGVGARPCGG